MMYELWIQGVSHEISEEKMEKLMLSGAIYPCGAEHGFHLTPDHSFTLGEVELLMSIE